MERLAKREEELAQRSMNFHLKFDAWEQTLSSESIANSKKTSNELLASLHEANENVERLQEELDEVKTKLKESAEQLKIREACFESYLSLMERQGMSPKARHFHDHLKLVKHRGVPKKVKCFISYAWDPDVAENAKLQGRLVRLKGN